MKPLVAILFLLCFFWAPAQKDEAAAVDWLTFEELETALTRVPKKVLVHFYADWCVYCKKMENKVYTKPDIVEALSKEYYAVKFDVEATDTIHFGGRTFTNENYGKQRVAYHQIPELLTGYSSTDLALPATVILDSTFQIEKRFFRYIPPREMRRILK